MYIYIYIYSHILPIVLYGLRGTARAGMYVCDFSLIVLVEFVHKCVPYLYIAHVFGRLLCDVYVRAHIHVGFFLWCIKLLVYLLACICLTGCCPQNRLVRACHSGLHPPIQIEGLWGPDLRSKPTSLFFACSSASVQSEIISASAPAPLGSLSLLRCPSP